MPSVWRDRDFVRYWLGQSVSLAGSSLGQVAVPLLAAQTLHAGPLAIGILGACVWLPFLGLPLLAGVVADRQRKLPLLVVANLVRGFVQVSAFVLAAVGLLTLPVLAIIALTVATATVFADVAEQAFLPHLVGRERLMHAYSANATARSVATVAGPSTAGLVVQVFGLPMAVLIDGLSFFAPAAAFLSIRKKEDPPARDTRKAVVREISEGLTFLWRTVPIRVMTLQGMLFNGFWQAATVPFLFYAIHDLGIGIGWWSVLLGMGGIGALIGSVLAPRIEARLGYGRSITLVSTGHLGLLLVPLLNTSGWTTVAGWGLGLICSGFASGVMNVVSVSTRARLTGDRMLGRVTASARLLLFAAMPVGAVSGGALATALGNHLAVWIAVVGMVASVVPLVLLRGYHQTARTAQS